MKIKKLFFTLLGLSLGCGMSRPALASTLLTPNFSVVGSTFVNVSWTPVGASSYTAVISTDNAFNVFTDSITSGANTFTTSTALQSNTTYFFHVKVSSEPDGSYGANFISTKTKSVSISMLNPIFTMVTSTVVQVQWMFVSGASYAMALSSDSAFNTVTASQTVGSNAFISPSALLPGTTYFFRVKISTESDGSYGANAISTKTLVGVTAPTMLNPNFIIVTSSSLSVSWGSVGASSYTAVLSTDNAFGVVTTSITSGSLSFTSGATLQSNTTYFFRVKVSSESDSSYAANFISTTTAVSVVPTMLNPNFTTVTSTVVQVQWMFVSGASYAMALSTDSAFNTVTTSQTVGSNAFSSPSALLTNTTYFFRVKLSTEADSSYAANSISTQTMPGATPTMLNPNYFLVTSSTLSVAWTSVGASSYTAVLSTDNAFGVVTTSITSGSLSFTSGATLQSNTTYFFRVKVSSESDSSYFINTVSTKTLFSVASGSTTLNPYFSFVGLDVISVGWNNISGANFVALLSTVPSFNPAQYFDTVNTPNRSYPPGLFQNTTYYFRVKVSTESDSNFSATISTKTLTSGGGGNSALSFIGANNQITMVPANSQLDLQSNNTLEFWFRRTTISNINETLLAKDNSSKSSGWAIALLPAGQIRYDALGRGGIQTISSITNTNWHHLALTRDSSGFTQIYLDGSYENSSNTLFPYTNGQNLKFGNSESLGNGFNGVLDEVRVWNVIRSQGVIQSSRSVHADVTDATLIGYWDFDEGVGQVVHNKSTLGNVFDGQLGFSPSAEALDPSWVFDPIPGFGAPADSTPPGVVVLTPLNGSTQTVSTLMMLSGTAQDNNVVQNVFVKIRRMSDGYSLNTQGLFWTPTSNYLNLANGTTSWSINTTGVYWSTGAYQLVAQAQDANFNVGIDTANFMVGVPADVVAPTVGIFYPVQSTTYTANQLLNFSGNVNDDIGLSKVRTRIIRLSDNKEWNNINVSWSTGPIFNDTFGGLYSWQFTLPISAWTNEDVYTLIARAEDFSNNFSTIAVTFNLQVGTTSTNDSIPPSVTIVHPATGTVHAPSALTSLYGFASDETSLVEVSVKVQDVVTGYSWNGSTFGSSSDYWFYMANPTNWSFGAIPGASWINGRQYSVTARAKDSSNNYSFTNSNFFVVAGSTADTIPPNVTISNPFDGGTFSPNGITFYGSAGDNVGLSAVEWNLRKTDSGLAYDGVSFLSASTQTFLTAAGLSAWSFYIPPAAFANGNYLLEVRARDTSNNLQSKIIGFTVIGASTTSDVTAPLINISSPMANVVYTNPSFLTTLGGTASDDISLSEVVFSLRDDTNKYWDGNAWSQNTEYWLGTSNIPSNWQAYVPFLAWKSGLFLMRARARDAANNISYASINFSVTGSSTTGNADANPPQSYIYNPANNANQGPYAFTYLNGRSEDSFGISEVAISLKNVGTGFYWNGAGFNSNTEWFLNPSIGLSDANSKEWNFSMSNSAYTNGVYVLRVRATDPSGNISTVSSSFTVFGAGAGAGDFTPPTIAISSPTDTFTYTASQMTQIMGTSADNVGVNTVEIRISKQSTGERWNGYAWVTGDIWLNVPAPTSNWNFFAPIAMWSDGNYSVSARARDAANNENIQTNNFILSGSGSAGTPPTVSIVTPIQSQTYTPASLVSVFGLATDNISVSSVQIRITDLNLNLDWNPDAQAWMNGDRWFTASFGGSNWNSGRMPLWSSGHFRLVAQSINSTNLFSAPQSVDFFVNQSTGASDVTAPAAITTLSAKTGLTDGSVVLSWTATGNDDTVGTASSYIIKYFSGAPITEANWYNAFDIMMPPVNKSAPVPLVSGSVQTSTITNLSPGLSYFWAMRALDSAGNRSGISNSPVATAFGGCIAGSGDGEGSVSLSPSSLPESTSNYLNLTFTVGASGITKGGKIKIKIPDGWIYPQTNYPGMIGYVTQAASNGSVTLLTEIAGSLITLSVQSGTLNANDTVTLNYLAMPSCGLQSNLKLSVLSQASSCGVPTEIAAQPTVAIVPGSATRIGFDTYEKLVPINQISSINLQGQSSCGSVAALINSVDISASVILSDPNTGSMIPDSSAQLSLASDLSSAFTNSSVTFSAGQSAKTIYYRLTSSANSGRNFLRIRYNDLQYPAYTSENMLRIVSVGQGQGLSALSVDAGQPGGAALQTTITPNGDGNADIAFINFNTGSSNLSWNVKISKDGFATTSAEFSGVGSLARVAWDGRRTYPYNDTAPAGTYQVRVSAGGQQSSTLSIVVQTNDVTGVVKNNADQSPIANAAINVFGAFNRYTQSDSSGTFTIGGLPSGTYKLQVDKMGYASLRNTINVTGSGQSLGNLFLSPQAKIIFRGTRADTSNEIWGSIKATDGGADLRGSVHFAAGRTNADDGFSVNYPELLLKPGNFNVSAILPGASVTPIQHTFVDGEIYYWDVSLTSKKAVSGQIRLASGISNNTGVSISLAAGLDANLDGRYDLGYPTSFANAFIPISENQTSYSFSGMDAGIYRVVAFAPGLTPEISTVTISTSDVNLDLILKQTGQAQLNVQFTGDTTALDTAAGDSTDGQFPVTVRLVSNVGFNVSKTIKLNTNATSSSGVMIFTGIPDGVYTIYVDALSGFDLNPVGTGSMSITSGLGSSSLAFVQNNGTIQGTVLLAPGSVLGNVQFALLKDGISKTSPVLGSNTFQFQNLKTGLYTLSAYDTSTQASQVLTIFVTNGFTSQTTIDLSKTNFYSLSGTVLTNAAPPYQNLNSIVTNSTATTLYIATGSFTLSALRVDAYLLKSDNTTDDLPIVPGRFYDPAKIKFGIVNPVTGSYQIDGLKGGARYKVRLNPDLNNDGVFDIPLVESVITLASNKSGLDFTITDGATILGTLTSVASDNAYPLTVTLTDTDLKSVVRTQSISLVGSDANFSFPNLRVGRYLIQIVDSAVPVKYAAKPSFVTIDNPSDNKSVNLNLFRSAIVRGKISDKFGQIINSSNVDALLPAGTKIKLTSVGHITEATGPDADGVYTASLLPDTDYTLELKPPSTSDLSKANGQGFIPITQKVRASAGQFYDWGVLALTAGTNLTGLVKDESDTVLANIPVFAYQALAKKLEPIKVLTNNEGNFIFESLDSRVRFYDIVVNPQGNIDSQIKFSEQNKTMVDLTKLVGQTLSFTLSALSGVVKGVVLPVSGESLIAAYGQNEGLSGVSLLVTKRGSQKVLEFLSESTGTFQLSLTPGRYDVEILAKNYKPLSVTNILVTNGVLNLGNIQLVKGVNLSGTLRNADGTLPLTEQVDKLLAIDSQQKIYRANLVQESVTQSIDRYTFNGLTTGTHTLVAVDVLGRLRVLADGFVVPNQDSILNLTFSVAEPQLVASFIQKLPDGVEAIFGCNQSFRNNLDDLNGNSTADDDEFDQFVTVVHGNGTLAFDSVSADRHKASYTYTKGNEVGISALELRGRFTTSEINPQSGSYFIVQGTFTHPFGLEAQQSDLITNLGGEFVLPGGAALSLPANWTRESNLEGVLVNFQSADSVDDVKAGEALMRGAGAMQLASHLGMASYPPQIYKAIKALSSSPTVNPFSSFYDIFLPANVSHVFNNKPTLTLTYDALDAHGNPTDPNTINVYYFNEAQGVYTIENVDRRVDTQNRTISVSIGHASVFTVLSSSVSIIRGDNFAGEISVFNFPNPFDLNSKSITLQNPGSASASQIIAGTMMKVSVPANVSGLMEIQIFNVAGEKVRTVTGDVPTGGTYYYLEWDGRNDHGEKVASGIYIGRLRIAGGNEKIFKMAVLK